jgi:hypothetical protein
MNERLNGHVPFYSRVLPANFSSKRTQFSGGRGSENLLTRLNQNNPKAILTN